MIDFLLVNFCEESVCVRANVATMSGRCKRIFYSVRIKYYYINLSYVYRDHNTT